MGDQSSSVAPPVTWLLRAMMKRSGWPKNIAGQLAMPPVRGHHAFAGVLRRESWPLSAHLVFRAMGGRYGDHRPWPEIEAWTDEIAAELVPVPAAAG